jgi:hypothetical protein
MRVLLLAATLLLPLSAEASRPFSARDLCEVWAAAQCHATSCHEDGRERCTAESRKCPSQSRTAAARQRADQVAACARALLRGRCGDPTPEECSSVTGP